MTGFNQIRYWILISAVTFILLLPAGSFGTPINDYLKSIKNARQLLQPFTKEDAAFPDGEEQKQAIAALKTVVGTLSGIESVEYKGYSVKVENDWLEKSLRLLEKEDDSYERLVIIQSVDERLASIETKISQVTKSGERESSKDDEKQRLAKILEREEFRPADVEGESPAAKLYRIISEWLRSLFPQMEPVTPQNSADFTLVKGFLQVVILLLVIAIISFVVFRFGRVFLDRISRKEKPAKSQLILGEEISAGTTTEDLFGDAEELARNGDIRGAIRKGYISLLFELSQRKLIGLAKHKTNRDYLRDLRKNKKLRLNVGGLTRNYERHWYGRQIADDPEWEEFKKGYLETLKTK